MRSKEEEDALTLAIMGPPRRFRLGVPVRPSEAGSANPALVQVGTFSRFLGAWTGLPRQHKVAAGAGFGVLALAVLLGVGLSGPGGGKGASTQAAPAPLQESPAGTQQAAGQTNSPQLPFAPPPAAQAESTPILPATVAIGVTSATFVPPSAAPAVPAKAVPLPPTPVAPQVAPPTTRPAAESEKPPAAVVLDASAKPAPGLPVGAPPVTPTSKPPQQAATPAIASPAPSPVGSGKLATPAREIPAVGGMPDAKPQEGAGPRVIVVDIDKSGSFALITNPQTRLPEKVTPGQKIFTGETIKKIDPAAGKIQLDSRTITMQ